MLSDFRRRHRLLTGECLVGRLLHGFGSESVPLRFPKVGVVGLREHLPQIHLLIQRVHELDGR
jgi:hypothetical protein